MCYRAINTNVKNILNVCIIRIFHAHEVKTEKVCPSVNCFWCGNEACRVTDWQSYEQECIVCRGIENEII